VSVVPSSLPSAQGGAKNSVGIFGRRVSTDALLLAGASVVAIILLYRSGRPSSAQQPLSLSGDGRTLVAAPNNALIASTPPASATGPIPPFPTLWFTKLGIGQNPTNPTMPGTRIPGFIEGDRPHGY
jgi:hypothetical protein